MNITESTALIGEAEEQLVIFTLGEESYGVNIEAVNTIIRIPDITSVPRAPDYAFSSCPLRIDAGWEALPRCRASRQSGERPPGRQELESARRGEGDIPRRRLENSPLGPRPGSA